MGIVELVTVAAFISVIAIMVVVRRQNEEAQDGISLRPMLAFQALRRQVGMALESGHPPLFALGRGPLHTASGPVSIAGLHVLQELVETSGRGQLTPQVMLGAATLLPLAQDTIRQAVEDKPEASNHVATVQFVADEAFPFTYGAATGQALDRNHFVSSIAVGRLGTELALIAEAANRQGVEQLMGSDDPAGIAVAIASSEATLWGEEVFAAGAYLRQRPWDFAAVRTQDILRWLLIVTLLGAALVEIMGLT